MAVPSVLDPFRVIPVVQIASVDMAAPLAEALKAGRLPVAEVTYRTPAATQAIRIMASDPELVVGAGTVITADQVDAAAGAGAQFIVSPGLSREVVERAAELSIPVIPGVATPTEIITALRWGITTVKFFPANIAGGVPALRAFSAVFPDVSFVPTGGVTLDTMGDYLAVPSVTAVGGSWMVPPAAMAAGDFTQIAERCAATVNQLEARARRSKR